MSSAFAEEKQEAEEEAPPDLSVGAPQALDGAMLPMGLVRQDGSCEDEVEPEVALPGGARGHPCCA